ncbi:MAG: hypothetical protein ACD_16C00208G0003 [uncultured bacterium]|nr:MAG: hypothetical protein ACD_16C00208G0003 [uncultured bacterium]
MLSASQKGNLNKHFHNENARRTNATTFVRRSPQQIYEVSIMAKSTVAQLEQLSQQLTRRFEHLEGLMTEAWLEHELIRGDLRDMFTAYYCWLGEEGKGLSMNDIKE